MHLSVYELSTGRIEKILSLPDGGGLLRQLAEGQDAVFGAYDDAEYWVDQGRVAPRPRIAPLPKFGQAPFALDLSALPAGAVLSVINEAGEVVEIADFAEALVFTDPGEYALAIKAPFPYFNLAGPLVLSATVGSE